MGMGLKYGDLIYDVIIDLFGIIFRNFYNQQNCMSVRFNYSVYNFNSSRFIPIAEVRSCCMFSETPCMYVRRLFNWIHVIFRGYIGRAGSLRQKKYKGGGGVEVDHNGWCGI